MTLTTLSVLTETTANEAGVNATAAALPNVDETTPSTFILIAPVQSANVKFLAGCIAVFVPLIVTPALENPLGTTIDTLIVRDVSVPTNE